MLFDELELKRGGHSKWQCMFGLQELPLARTLWERTVLHARDMIERQRTPTGCHWRTNAGSLTRRAVAPSPVPQISRSASALEPAVISRTMQNLEFNAHVLLVTGRSRRPHVVARHEIPQ